MPDTKTKTQITQLGTVVVPVTDQDRALEFYTEKLGFELRNDIPMGDGLRWIDVAPAGAETTIALFPPRPGEPIGIDTNIGLTTTDVDADHAALRSEGIDVDDEVSRMGDPVPPMFFLRDPDGNKLFVVQGS